MDKPSPTPPSPEAGAQPEPLPPLPYHRAICDFLMAEEAELWQWFVNERADEERSEKIRIELLKSTYRLDRDDHPRVYAAAERAAEALGLDVPLTVYQAQSGLGLNAALSFVPGQAHVILDGPVLDRLDDDELLALFGHELAHFQLLQGAGGELLNAQEILEALAADPEAAPHAESARRFGLYTEVYADRGSLRVTGDPNVTVSTLVKMSTGAKEVNPGRYIEQAAEVLSKDTSASAACSHPEAYIRTRAIQLWHEQGNDAEQEVTALLEGPANINSLDLLEQRRLRRLTRRVLQVLLAVRWFQTEAVLGHARLFFKDFETKGEDHADDALFADIAAVHAITRDYICYLLLDFITVDRDLEDLPLARALLFARLHGFEDRFIELVRKELGMTKKAVTEAAAEAAELAARGGA